MAYLYRLIGVFTLLFLCLELFPLTEAVKHLSKPKYRCPHGYLKEGINCVSHVYEKPKVTCKHGKLHKGECVKYVEAKPVCPEGYTLSHSSHFKAFRNLRKVKHLRKAPPQCVRVTTVPPVPYCPPSYCLEAGECVRTETIPPVCPPATSDVGQHCVSYSPALKECPPGFLESSSKHHGGKHYKHDSGHDCFRKTAIDGIPVCPIDFKLEGDECVRRTLLPPVCPPGTEDTGDMCMTYVEARRKCPKFFTLTSKNECEKSFTTKAEEYCKPGYDLVNHTCIKTTVVFPVCPPGTKDVGDKCARHSTPTIVCPDSFVLSKNYDHFAKKESVCTKKIFADMIPVCKYPRSVLEGDVCVHFISHEPICPSGTTENGIGCVSYKPAQKKCPAAYEMKRHGKNKFTTHYNCVQTLEVEVTKVCSEGYFLVGDRCEQTCSVPATPMCTKGARQGHECVEYSLCKPKYSCTEGFEYVGNRRCEKQVTQECQKVDYETRCYDIPECFDDTCSEVYEKFHKKRKLSAKECSGDECDADIHSSTIRALHGMKHHNSYGDKFEVCKRADDGCTSKKSKSKNDRLCETVAVETSDMCHKTITANALMVCPDGSLTENEQCRIAQYHDLSYVCTEGNLDSAHNCVAKKFQQSSSVCPDGFRLSKSKNFKAVCKSIETAQMEYYCTDGELVEGNRCATYVGKQCPGGKCESKITKPATHICTEGYTQASGHRCVATESISVAHVCAAGELTHSGRCVEYFSKECPGGSCEVTSKTNVEYRCDEDLSAAWLIPKKPKFPSKDKLKHHDKQCHKKMTKPAIPYCGKKETLLDDSRCATYTHKSCPNGCCEKIDYAPLSYECPPGHMMHHNKCIFVEYAPYEIFCNDGRLVDNCKCASYVSKQCPLGGCEVTDTVPPLYDCPLGFGNSAHKHGNGMCQTTDVVDVEYKCTDGFYSDCNMCKAAYKPEPLCTSQIALYEPSGQCSYKKFSVPEHYDDHHHYY